MSPPFQIQISCTNTITALKMQRLHHHLKNINNPPRPFMLIKMASWHLVSQMYTSIQKMQNLHAEKVSSLKEMITSMLLFCEGVGAQPSDVTFPTSKIGLCDIGTNPFGPVSNPGLCKPTKNL